MTTKRLGLIMNGVTGRMGTNQHLLRSIVAIRDQAVKKEGVNGTPSFLINGKLAEGVYDFGTLKTALDTALGG